MELLNLLILSKELDLISEAIYSDIRKNVEELSNKLNALQKAQKETN